MESLYLTLKTELNLDMREEAGIQVARHVVSYLCGVTTAYQAQAGLKPYIAKLETQHSAKTFRLHVVGSSYNLLNIKFMALNLCLRPPTPENIMELSNTFGVGKNDAVLLRKCFLDKKWRAAMRKSDRVKAITKANIDEAAMDEVKIEITEMYSDLMRHIKSVCYTRLRFLIKAENCEAADFHSDMMYKAMRAYYMMVPTKKTKAHILNSLRSTCTNHALNIIEEKTTNKRQRMVNDGADGFGGNTYSMRCVSENQMIASDGEAAPSYEATLNTLNSSDGNRMLSNLNFERLVQRMGITAKRRRALLILSGKEDRRFTKYLLDCGIIAQGEDCTDFVHRCGFDTVVTRLSVYLNVRKYRLVKFFEQVGTELKQGSI